MYVLNWSSSGFIGKTVFTPTDVAITGSETDFASTTSFFAFVFEKHHNIFFGLKMDNCPICLDALQAEDNVTTLPCGHKMHTNCALKSAWEGCIACPVCRRIPSGLHERDVEENIDMDYEAHNEAEIQRLYLKGLRQARKPVVTQRLRKVVDAYKKAKEKLAREAKEAKETKSIHKSMKADLLIQLKRIKEKYTDKYTKKQVDKFKMHTHTRCSSFYSKRRILRRHKRKIAIAMGFRERYA